MQQTSLFNSHLLGRNAININPGANHVFVTLNIKMFVENQWAAAKKILQLWRFQVGTGKTC